MKPENEMTLTFPSKSANESFARAAVACFAAQLDPNLEELNDIKTAVSEAVTNCIVHAYRDTIGTVTIRCRILPENILDLVIRDKGCGMEDVEQARAELLKLIAGLSEEMKEIFSASFAQINEHFNHIFAELFGGGTASLTLTEPDNILESGIDISVAPPGKLIKNLSSLSGGEQALVAVSIYFAILAVNPSPFCVLDEIEAALDDVNVVRYAQYLKRISDRTQFIVITHRRGTMEEADVLYGVTMQEDGVSRVLRLDPENVDVHLIGAEK